VANLHDTLDAYVGHGSVPGAVGLVARGDRIEAAAVGSVSLGGAPMTRDSIFRLASITKPVTAAAVMLLVQDGRIALDDPVAKCCPNWPGPSSSARQAWLSDTCSTLQGVLIARVSGGSLPDFLAERVRFPEIRSAIEPAPSPRAYP
jgi:hypothetical protein